MKPAGINRPTQLLMPATLNVALPRSMSVAKVTEYVHCDRWDNLYDIAETLIRKSVELNFDLNAQDNDGDAAFHYTCEVGPVKVVELFLKKSVEFNINLNATNRKYDEVSHGSGDNSILIDIVKTLETVLSIKCDHDLKLTAFHEACFNGQLEVVKMFVKYFDDITVDLDVKDNMGMFSKWCMVLIILQNNLSTF